MRSHRCFESIHRCARSSGYGSLSRSCFHRFPLAIIRRRRLGLLSHSFSHRLFLRFLDDAIADCYRAPVIFDDAISDCCRALVIFDDAISSTMLSTLQLQQLPCSSFAFASRVTRRRTRRADRVTIRASTTTDDNSDLSVSESSSSSLLSPLGIARTLAADGISLVDHYGRLQITPEATTGEIFQAYRKRRTEIMAQSLEESVIQKQLQDLQDSTDILTSEEERRMYDWSLLRLQNPGGDYIWPFEADITQRFSDSPPNKTEEDDEGNRNVALFFLGWFILSCVLSIVLPRLP